MNQLYTVTLTDLGSYRITVAAGSPAEAESVAKTVMIDEAAKLPNGLAQIKREVDATAELASVPGARDYRVSSTYSVEFEMTVPATTYQEAEQHARRLYADNWGPFEFATGEERVGPFTVREVQS